MLQFEVMILRPGHLNRLINKAASMLIDNKKMHKDALAEVDQWIQLNFESEGQMATSTGWPSLKPASVRRRRKGSSRILQDRGFLRRGWKHQVTRDGGVVFEKAKTGGAPFYGEAHHKGKGRLPRRPIIPTPDQIKDEIRGVYEHHIKKAVGVVK